MRNSSFLMMTAVAIILSQIVGCASPKLAQTPLDPQEQEWEASIKQSYPAWDVPQTEPPVDINMVPGENPQAIMVDGKIVELTATNNQEQAIVEDVVVIEPVANNPVANNQSQSYIVQKGDTLWKIADKFYGDGKKWQIIADANVNVLPNPNKVKPGISITIPAAK